jgi:hypothetical protein
MEPFLEPNFQQIKRTGTLHGGSGGNANLNIISRATNGSFFTVSLLLFKQYIIDNECDSHLFSQ